MKVSIITVVRNGEETLNEAIQSVLNQMYPNIEYVIIDGNSTDGTVNIIKSYGDKISRWISEPDRGIYDAMNKGLQLTTGDVIGILNADDSYTHPLVITDVVEALENQAADAVYGDLIYLDRKSPKILRYWKSGSYRPGNFRLGWMPPHPTFFAKKKIYMEYGLFDTRLTSAADYELMLRFIHKHKIKLAYIPEVLVKMKVGGKSNASLLNRLRANKEDGEAWRLNGYISLMATTSLKPLRKIPQYFMKPAAMAYRVFQEEADALLNNETVSEDQNQALNIS